MFGKMWLYSCKSVCIRAGVVVFGQNWLYYGKMLYSGKIGCNWQKCSFSGKVAVFGMKWFYSGKSCSIRAKWLYSGKVVVFGQMWFYSGKAVVFGKSMLRRRLTLETSAKHHIPQATNIQYQPC